MSICQPLAKHRLSSWTGGLHGDRNTVLIVFNGRKVFEFVVFMTIREVETSELGVNLMYDSIIPVKSKV